MSPLSPSVSRAGEKSERSFMQANAVFSGSPFASALDLTSVSKSRGYLSLFTSFATRSKMNPPAIDSSTMTRTAMLFLTLALLFIATPPSVFLRVSGLLRSFS